MTSPTKLARSRLRVALGAMVLLILGASASVDAQVVQGVEKGAREGNKAAGPVGGVLGGAIGGVVGVVTGVTGVLTGNNNNNNNNNSKNAQPPAPAAGDKQTGPKNAKQAKAAKDKGAKPPAVLTQDGAPQLTADKIVANSDANI